MADTRAFSSEVGTGSREETRQNKNPEPPFRFNRNGGSRIAIFFKNRTTSRIRLVR
jgi:hypothetical protein